MVGFKPWRLFAAEGAVWALDAEFPLLVRCDPATRVAEVAATLPVPTDAERPGPEMWPAGPQSVAALHGELWMALPRTQQLARYSLSTGAVSLLDAPMAPTALAAGPDRVYAVGGSGDGRMLVVGADGEQTVVELGKGLRLIAAASPWVWVVDDAAGEVVVLDESTLSVAQRFQRLGAPGLLLARGDVAWYLSMTEIERIGSDGRRQRAAVMQGGGLDYSLLELSARTGNTKPWTHVRGLDHVGAVDAAGIWLAGRQQDNLDDRLDDSGPWPDPISPLHRFAFDGAPQQAFTVSGQLDALAVLNDEVWIAGFRRSRQDFVISVFDSHGQLRGEVDLTGVDVTPWRPPPRPRSEPVARDEFASRARAALSTFLTEQQQWTNRFGEQWDAPPISDQFHLVRVEATNDEVAVLFHWGEDGITYGKRYKIDEDDLQGDWWGDTPEEWAGNVLTSLEEDLLAGGYGIHNASKTTSDGVAWLDWTAPG